MLHNMLKEDSFDELTREGIVLVDFWAEWCPPCKVMNPILKSFAEDVEDVNLDVKVVKVDVDQFPELSQKYGIMSIPTILFFKDGVLTDHKIIGLVEKFVLRKTVNDLVAA